MVKERTRELKDAQQELIKKEKLSVLGQLTATVSHELRNPLGVIRSSNFYLQRRLGSKDVKAEKHFRRIEDQIAICNGIVADLLEYTRGRKVLLKKAPVQEWLETLIQEMTELMEIKIQTDLPCDLPPVPHDQEKLRRVFINLIENAIHATRDRLEAEKQDKGGAYQPGISVTAEYGSGQLMFHVADNGTGMEKAVLDKAFEPLFTTRARGTGIGLAAVHKITRDHNGTIKIFSEPGRGTTVIIGLPV